MKGIVAVVVGWLVGLSEVVVMVVISRENLVYGVTRVQERSGRRL